MIKSINNPQKVIRIKSGKGTGDNYYTLEDGSVWKTSSPFFKKGTDDRTGRTDGCIHYETRND